MSHSDACPKCSGRTVPSPRMGKRRCNACAWEFDPAMLADVERPLFDPHCNLDAAQFDPESEDETVVPVLGGAVRVAPGRDLPADKPAPKPSSVRRLFRNRDGGDCAE